MPRFFCRSILKWVPVAMLLIAVPQTSHALRLNKDVKDVMVMSGYGLIAGTAVGLATLPLTQDLRVTLMGSSVGLYMGIAAGIFYVLNRPEPSRASLARFETREPPNARPVRFDVPTVQVRVLRF